MRRVGDVQLVCSTTKPHLKTATPDDVKILLTNATGMSVTEVIELDSLRGQIELFFQERKSTLGFHQYRFQDFAAVRAWAEIALTTVLFLEYERAKHLTDCRAPRTPDAGGRANACTVSARRCACSARRSGRSPPAANGNTSPTA